MNSVPWSAFNYRVVPVFVVAALVLVGCDRDEPSGSSKSLEADVRAYADSHDRDGDGHEQDAACDHENDRAHEADDAHKLDEPHEGDGAAENHDESEGDDHIAIPPAVRRNLGITFVKAELRPVRSTIRVPGQFELRPEARREYHTMLPGRVELLVSQFQKVKPGDPLFHLDSPEWEKMKSELVNVQSAMRRSHADVAVAEATLNEARKAVELLEKRVANLAEAEVRQASLEAELADKRNTLPRLQAELEAAKMEFETAHIRYKVMINTAASLTGVPREQLDPANGDHSHMEGKAAPWQSIHRLTIRAEAPGIVDRIGLTNRGWAGTADLVLDTVDPTVLRFHADALQTDIALFEDGQQARIAPPPGGSIPLQDTMDGTIEVGFQAHAEQRIIPLYLVPGRLPKWAKAGVTAYLEVFLKKDDKPVVAIPKAAVVRDGLDMVFFLREVDDPDHVIRVEAELGHNDGRWVEIASRLEPGDEVVLGGVYPLVLASSASGQVTQGGHMDSDGTFHIIEKQ